MKDLWELLGTGHLDALEAAKGLPATPRNLERAAHGFGIDAARWAFEQWDLRRRARTKFEKAEAMFFDREALEMATHEKVAWLHAVQFPPRVRVADLTVGIGADLIALARENEAVGYEIDPIRASMARHNLRVHKLDAEIRLGDCLLADWDFDYAFADPARRSGGRRAVRAEDYQPPLAELAGRMSELALGLIKVSPMLPDETLKAHGRRVDFGSFGGECREAVLRVGRELVCDDGSVDRSVWALHVESGRWLANFDFEHVDVDPEPLAEPLAVLYEADPAAIRAHALPLLCQNLKARLLGDSNGYLTGNVLADDLEAESFARAFRVLTFGRADPKRIREELRKRGARVGAVKLRAVREDPSAWIARLRSKGNREVVLILYPVGKSLRFVLAEPA